MTMPKPMEITLSLYARDLENLEGAMPEKERLALLELAKRETEEENRKQREKSEEELRKDTEGISRPYEWYRWDEGKQEIWTLAEIKRRQSIVYETDDHYFEGLTFTLPLKWEVCGRCDGEGVHDHEGFSDGFTQSEWAEETCEFRESYMNGAYDVTCSGCGGKRVMAAVDERYLNEGLKALLDLYYEECQATTEYDSIAAAERRMGA